MLMMWFTLHIINAIHAKYFLDSFTNLDFSIVTKESIWCTELPDEVNERTWHLRFFPHREESCDEACSATVELDHL
jgi:hypothetical protein